MNEHYSYDDDDEDVEQFADGCRKVLLRSVLPLVVFTLIVVLYYITKS